MDSNDQRLRILAAQLAIVMHEDRPAGLDDVLAATYALYDFFTAEWVEEDDDGGELDIEAPDNAQVYGKGH